MPIYDYQCRECRKISEMFLRDSKEDVVYCPDCGSENMEKLISASYMIRMDTSAPSGTCCGRNILLWEISGS